MKFLTFPQDISPPGTMSRVLAFLVLILTSSASLSAQSAGELSDTVSFCPSCDAWTASRQPVRLFGNAYYVGTRGLSAVLLTSADGHVLLDGGLPQSAAVIIANIRALGFRIEDVRLIVNSHAHYDHAGGIAALQRASGATVAASAWSASVMRAGMAQPGDPQLREALRFPKVPNVRVIANGDTLRVGSTAVVAHFTGGHTPGGTSWTWTSCERDTCRSFVYADSQSPISDDGFLYTTSREYPTALEEFARGFQTLERLSCDVLITPHPEAVNLFERLAARDAGQPNALVDAEACKRYASTARTRLAARVARERSGTP
jgi:metallo-beta-lactamase class B